MAQTSEGSSEPGDCDGIGLSSDFEACAAFVGRHLHDVDVLLTAPPVHLRWLMDLRVPPELEAKLNRLAAETGRHADQVALDLRANSVEHDDWFRREVEKGRVAAREGRLLDHDEVTSRIGQRYRG